LGSRRPDSKSVGKCIRPAVPQLSGGKRGP